MVQPELSQELWVRLIRQLGDRVGPVGFVYPLLMLAVALKSSVPRDHPLIYSLGALLSLAGAVWLALTARKARTAGPDNWINIREELRVVTLILATLWALLSGFGLYAYPNSDFSVALLFAILGWLSVGAIVFSPDLNLALIFIHLHILPAIIWSYQVRDRFGLALILLFAMIWAALYVVIEWSSAHLRYLLLSQIQLESQSEDLRQSRERAESSSRTRTRFLATISHQIRTPLNGILGVNDLLLDSQLDSQQAELVSLINQSSQRLLHLVNNLLDLSQIDTGKLQLSSVEFDLRRLIEEISRPISIAAAAKGLDWTVRFRREVPTSCLGDPLRLKQVIDNLLRNALKFTDRGSITIEVGMADGGHVLCVVQDTGTGIPPQKIATLFDEFKPDSDDTPSLDGAGLSLAISRKLIDLMGGRIGVQSAPGQGSRVWFEIPVIASTSEIRS
ncbi:MAG: sensor histidine kinase [Acidobacteriota bacterium]